ncbi:glutamate racemase [Draconibacterium sp. IB214405]|uniref:glutamate racemase n=1 Tax=Draconibacterium sp. IB214405 TaxID=3097352 RepID=UPI002A0E2B50|nr:glutamate racemase [Draconibacterium sp. IB214405]MDX8339214.1 glutamate racemase [Draconibacterium sp. IB214405]
MKSSPIGVFDSGYGGLTVLKELIKSMPENDFLYLGDNARTPYGTRSFDVVYDYTLQAVKYLFAQGCPLVIIACNTASAKALRNIQMLDLPHIAPDNRVLGVIRPSVEKVAEITKNGHVGVLGTVGTVVSESYPIELEKWSEGRVKSTVQEACPMWVPLVENNEIENEGADYFVHKNIDAILAKDQSIDTLILGCTHYPLLIDLIKKYVPENVSILNQGAIVAEKLVDYLKRHPEMEQRLSKEGSLEYQTTESAATFESKAALFMGSEVNAKTVHL